MSFVGPDVRVGHVVQLARARFGRATLTLAEAHPGEDVVGVPRELLLELLAFFRDDRDLALGLLVDVTCVDRLGATPPSGGGASAGEGDDRDEEGRFLVVYRLKSPRLGYRARVLVEVPEHDPVLPSVTGLFVAADWLERELWDLFGIYPDGHPHLRRLLLYEGFSGHPLRRDYPANKPQPLVPLRSLPAPVVVASLAADSADGDDDDDGDEQGVD